MKKNPSILVSSDTLNFSQKKSMGVLNYTPRERQENEALPVSVDKLSGLYVPDKNAYYRNDGHKNIRSRVTV
jgi:hypothetical protein